MAAKVIAVAQQKGGSGKTTLAANLAVAFSQRGQRVALLDTDPQGSLGRWFMLRRDRRPKNAIDFATSSAWGVGYECEKLARDVDLVIIDTPPKIDADLRPALREADLVLVPVAASHMDLWATESVLDLCKRVERKTLLVLNRASPRALLTTEIRSELDALDPARSRTTLGNRVAYAQVLGQGLGVTELASGRSAAAEIVSLASEIEALIPRA
jgi:chromosome partitioning protein